MRYFFDWEFLENGETIKPISLGMVAEDGRELYLEAAFDEEEVLANGWLKDNVVPYLTWNPRDRVSREELAQSILSFVGDDPHPEFWAYYAAYDWVLLCQMFGRMIDLPKGWPKYCRDLQQRWDYLGLSNYSKPQQPEDQHCAIADARWNKKLWEMLQMMEGFHAQQLATLILNSGNARKR